jgi:phospholipase/lecithinase/hemolysin
MQRTRISAALLLALPLLAGCHDNEPLNAPDLSSSNGLMARYVSMGNSITAGYQSAGINDSTQQRSYAVLFANRANAPFFVPSLQGRGCAPPLVNNVTKVRVGGDTSSTTCDLRANQQLFYVSNVAVPGATSFSPTDNLSAFANSNALTTFILGGRTQVQAMMDAKPTFVSVWIGNNDVLGALTSSADPGNPALVTPLPVFEANYTAILDSIQATGAKAILISVADVTLIPYTSMGAVYWCLRTGVCPGVPAAAFPPNFGVNINCAPGAAVAGQKGDSILVPWTVGVPKIAAAAQGAPAGIPQTTLNCATDPVVSPSEYANMHAAVVGYNAFIQSEAATRGMAYLDGNVILAAAKAAGDIPLFPDLSGLATLSPITFQKTGAPAATSLFSLDGVHPSTLAHQLIADSVASAVNQFFGTQIPLP